MRLEKIVFVKKYLSQTFNESVVENRRDFDCMAETFRIIYGDNTYDLKISDEFLDDYGCEEIAKKFSEWHLAKYLTTNKNKTILLTTIGLEVAH